MYTYIYNTDAPHFVFNNAKEIYVYLNRTTELKVRFVANPVANTILLIDNKLALEANCSDIMISVQKATVVDYYHDKAVSVNGYAIGLQLNIRDRLEFGNITIMLENNRGSSNYTIQIKTASKFVY